jgi:hypothetical protein
MTATPVPAVEDDPGKRGVAMLLAAAAALATILALRASFLADEAAGAWQSALRTELQRAAALLQEVRQVYGTEGPEAFIITTHEVLGDEMRSHARGASPVVTAVLETEARVHEDLVAQVKPATELTASGYELPAGGYDLSARLAHVRGARPEAVALDPDGLLEQGDRASRHRLGVVAAGVPIGVALLAGALALPHRSRRRSLLALGWLALGVSVCVAVGLEASW